MDINSFRFDSVRLFKAKNSGKKIKNVAYSELYNLSLPTQSLFDELKDRDFVATLLGLQKVEDNMYIIPFPALRRMLGITLKKSLALKIEGPKVIQSIITYVLYDGTLLYEVSFRVIDHSNGNCSLSVSLVIYYAETFLKREDKVKKRLEIVTMSIMENMRKVLAPYLITHA